MRGGRCRGGGQGGVSRAAVGDEQHGHECELQDEDQVTGGEQRDQGAIRRSVMRRRQNQELAASTAAIS